MQTILRSDQLQQLRIKISLGVNICQELLEALLGKHWHSSDLAQEWWNTSLDLSIKNRTATEGKLKTVEIATEKLPRKHAAPLRIRESTFHGCQPLSKVLAP